MRGQVTKTFNYEVLDFEIAGTEEMVTELKTEGVLTAVQEFENSGDVSFRMYVGYDSDGEVIASEVKMDLELICGHMVVVVGDDGTKMS